MDRIRSLVHQHVSSATVLLELRAALPLWPSLWSQAALAREVLAFDPAYPLSVRYYRYLLKVIMKDIESSINSSGADVDCDECGIDDSLAELVVNSQLLVDDVDDTCYMRFNTPAAGNGATNEVKIQVFRSHNQVGCRLWDAGLFMSAFLIGNYNALRGKRVVELGAGVGMSAITYAVSAAASEMQCTPASVVITDFHSDVLLLIKSNIKLNKHLFPSTNVTTAKVDWFDLLGLSEAIPHPPDFIFAADCTYSSELHGGLVDTVKDLLHRPGRLKVAKGCVEDASFRMDSFLADRFVARDSSDAVPLCMIASCRRTEDTYGAFLDVLAAKGETLGSVDVTQWALGRSVDRLYHYNHIDLLRIRLIVPVE